VQERSPIHQCVKPVLKDVPLVLMPIPAKHVLLALDFLDPCALHVAQGSSPMLHQLVKPAPMDVPLVLTSIPAKLVKLD
jgi:hypothetical protein